MRIMKAISKKIFALLMVLAAIFSSPTLAASVPIIDNDSIPLIDNDKEIIMRASYYLSSYAADCSVSGNTVSVDYNVTATRVMNYVGAIGVYLYESSNGSNFTCVRTFYPSGNPNMLRQNFQFHATSVTYNGISGRYYYAVVSFYAENSNGSDTKSYTTSTIRL